MSMPLFFTWWRVDIDMRHRKSRQQAAFSERE